MTTIDHAGALAVSRPAALSDERVASRALQVARRTALGVLGDAEAAADIAQDVAISRATSSARIPCTFVERRFPDSTRLEIVAHPRQRSRVRRDRR